MISQYLLALLGVLMAAIGGLFIAAIMKAVDQEAARLER